MKRLLAPVLLGTLCACTPAPQVAAPPPAASISQVVSVAPPTPASPLSRASIPESPALTISLDPAQLTKLASTVAQHLEPASARNLHEAFTLHDSEISSGRFAEAMGLDPSRQAVLALYPIDEGGQAIVEAGRGALGKLDGEYGVVRGLSRIIEDSLTAHRGAVTQLRIILPVLEATRTSSAVVSMLERAEYKRVEPPPDFHAIFAKRQRVVAVSAEPRHVIVDLLQIVGDVPAAKIVSELAITALRARDRQPARSLPAPAPGQLARVTYEPAMVAQLGFADSIGSIHDAARRLDEPTRDAMMTRGMRDTGAILALVGNDRGPYFRRVDAVIELDAGLPRMTARLALGEPWDSAPAAAWAPSMSVAFPGALARFDISTAAMSSIRVPGDSAAGPLEGRSFERLVQSAGWAGWPAALPVGLIGATRIPLEWNAGVGRRAMLRFERFGWANAAFGAPDVFWGLLPRTAGKEELACAVDEKGPGCKGKRRIREAGVQDIGGAWARVVKVADRYVVLTSRDKKAVSALTPTPAPTDAPPLRGAISAGSLQRLLADFDLAGGNARVLAEATRDGDTLVVRVWPATE